MKVSRLLKDLRAQHFLGESESLFHGLDFTHCLSLAQLNRACSL
jgi:hypothetical protein